MVIELKKLTWSFKSFDEEGGSAEEEAGETLEEVDGEDDFDFATEES